MNILDESIGPPPENLPHTDDKYKQYKIIEHFELYPKHIESCNNTRTAAGKRYLIHSLLKMNTEIQTIKKKQTQIQKIKSLNTKKQHELILSLDTLEKEWTNVCEFLEQKNKNTLETILPPWTYYTYKAFFIFFTVPTFLVSPFVPIIIAYIISRWGYEIKINFSKFCALEGKNIQQFTQLSNKHRTNIIKTAKLFGNVWKVIFTLQTVSLMYQSYQEWSQFQKTRQRIGSVARWISTATRLLETHDATSAPKNTPNLEKIQQFGKSCLESGLAASNNFIQVSHMIHLLNTTKIKTLCCDLARSIGSLDATATLALAPNLKIANIIFGTNDADSSAATTNDRTRVNNNTLCRNSILVRTWGVVHSDVPDITWRLQKKNTTTKFVSIKQFTDEANNMMDIRARPPFQIKKNKEKYGPFPHQSEHAHGKKRLR
jgi:hypothetical protein